eukprot:401778-Rhodomonas_salina.1
MVDEDLDGTCVRSCLTARASMRSPVLASCVWPMQCPGLTWGVWWYQPRSRCHSTGGLPPVLCACYAMSGTDLAYAYCPMHLLRHVRAPRVGKSYGESKRAARAGTSLCVFYAMSGPDMP